MKVYSHLNYKKEWDGRTDDGQELPDGTYYYLIEFEDRESKTGWVYLTREYWKINLKWKQNLNI